MFWTVSLSIIRGLALYIQVMLTANIPIAVCTVLDSWWWTEKLSETRRFLFQK